jgi:hypothetical protein
VGGLLGDLNPEGLDSAYMDHLGGVTDKIMAAQMEILAENEVSDSGEDTVGADLKDDVSFSGRGTHNSVAPQFKYGARVVYLGQGGDEMRLGYVVTAHGDIEWGVPFYTVNLEGFGEKQIEGQCLFPVASQEEHVPPLCPFQCHTTPLTGPLKPRKTNMPRRNTSSRCMNWPRLSNNSVWKTRNRKSFSQMPR